MTFPVGSFAGRIVLDWTGPNDFIYQPVGGFVFVRSTGEVIQPDQFHTDGGSTPRWATVVGNDFDRFGDCFPGFLIHDWLFELNRMDKGTTTFKGSAQILGECLETLNAKGWNGKGKKRITKAAIAAIFIAVSSPVARELWHR